MTSIDERLERALDDAPPPSFTVDDVLAAGRGRARRRRVAASGVLVTAVAAGSLGATLLLGPAGPGGAGGAGDDRAAGEPTPAARDDRALDAAGEPVPGTRVVTGENDLRAFGVRTGEIPIVYGDDGTLEVSEGWRLTQLIPDPVASRPGGPRLERSTAAEVVRGARRIWALLATFAPRTEVERNRASMLLAFDSKAPAEFPDLESWARIRGDLALGGRSTRLVRLADDGFTVVGLPGVEVLGQRIDIDLAPQRSGERQGRPVTLAHLRVGEESLWVTVDQDDPRSLATVVPVDEPTEGLTPLEGALAALAREGADVSRPVDPAMVSPTIPRTR